MTTERIWPKQSNLEEYLKEYPEHKQRYLLASSFSKGSNCADISCGAGYGSYILGEFANSVIGYDLSLEALKHAEINFTRENVSFKNIKELKNIKFDLVVSLETLEHMSEKDGDEFLTKIARSIKSNGNLVVRGPGKNQNASVLEEGKFSAVNWLNKDVIIEREGKFKGRKI